MVHRLLSALAASMAGTLVFAAPLATPEDSRFDRPFDGINIDSPGIDTHAGASGADTGGITMSTGAIVGMSIGIGIVVIGIAVLTWLYFMTKRRNWQLRERMRRASKRLATPLSARFPRRGPLSPTHVAANAARRGAGTGAKGSPRNEKTLEVVRESSADGRSSESNSRRGAWPLGRK